MLRRFFKCVFSSYTTRRDRAAAHRLHNRRVVMIYFIVFGNHQSCAASAPDDESVTGVRATDRTRVGEKCCRRSDFTEVHLR